MIQPPCSRTADIEEFCSDSCRCRALLVQSLFTTIIGVVPITLTILRWCHRCLRQQCEVFPQQPALRLMESFSPTDSRRSFPDFQPMAEKHHPGESGPPEACESPSVQAAMSRL